MDCKLFRRDLPDLLSGTPPYHLPEEAARHMDSCSACREIYDRLSGMNAIIETEKATEPNPFASTRLLQRIENQLGTETRTQAIPALIWIRSAAVAFSIMAGALLGFYGAGGDTVQEETGGTQDGIALLRSELYFPAFTDEDIIIDLNE